MFSKFIFRLVATLRTTRSAIPTTASATVTATVTATSAAIPTATAATTEGTTRALFTRTGFVHGQVATIQRLAIQRFDRCLSRLFRPHRDERKPTGASAHAIHHQIHFADRAVLSEEILKIIFSDIVGEISHK